MDSRLRIEVRGEGGDTLNMTNAIRFSIYLFKISGKFDATGAGLEAAEFSGRSQTAIRAWSVRCNQRGASFLSSRAPHWRSGWKRARRRSRVEMGAEYYSIPVTVGWLA
jgi:hypothetical protein